MLRQTLVASVAALALAAGAAYAAPPGGPGMVTPAPGAWQRARVAADLARVKAELQITTAQEGAWKGFTTALEGLHARRWTRPAAAATVGLVPAPQVFSMLAKHAREKAERARKLAEAAGALYQRLTPVQRAILDTHLADVRAMLHRWHGRRGEMRWQRVRPMLPQSPPGGA